MHVEQNIRTILRFLVQVESDENIPSADALFVFGHADPRVAEHASTLYFKGKANIIIVTGMGKEEKLPLGFKTEAEYLISILCASGVPEESIISEYKATNTLENVLFGMAAARATEFDPKSLILCAKPPLLRRAQATFRKQFPKISVYGSAYKFRDEEWIGKEIIMKRILGEIV